MSRNVSCMKYISTTFANTNIRFKRTSGLVNQEYQVHKIFVVDKIDKMKSRQVVSVDFYWLINQYNRYQLIESYRFIDQWRIKLFIKRYTPALLPLTVNIILTCWIKTPLSFDDSIVIATVSASAGFLVNTGPPTIVAVLRSNLARASYIQKK